MRFAILAIFAAMAVALPTSEQDVAARTSVDACPGCDPRAVGPAPMVVAQPRNKTLEMMQARTPAEGAPKAAEAKLEEMEVEEKTSKRGKKYRVYRPKGSAAAEAKAKKQLSKRYSDHWLLPMNWQAGHAGMTSPTFSYTTGIDQWNIHIGGFFYQYRLNFHTVQSANYLFEDESGDWYSCWVYWPGQHYIDYNSAQPNMVQSQGT